MGNDDKAPGTGSGSSSNSMTPHIRSRSTEKAPLTLEFVAQILSEMETRMTANINKANTSTNDKISKVAKAIKELEKVNVQRFEVLEAKMVAQEEGSVKVQEQFLVMQNEIS